MSQRILTDDEVQSLLRGLAGEDDDVVELTGINIRDNKEHSYIPYNLMDTVHKLICGRFPGLEKAIYVLTTKLSKEFSKIFKKDIQFNPLSIDVVDLNNFLKSVPSEVLIDHYVDNYLNTFYIITQQKCLKAYNDLITSTTLNSEEEDYYHFLISKKIEKIVNYSLSKIIPNWRCKIYDQSDNPHYIQSADSVDHVCILTIEVFDSYFILIIPITMTQYFKKYLKDFNNNKYKAIDDSIDHSYYEYLVNSINIEVAYRFIGKVTLSQLLGILKVGQEVMLNDQHIYCENILDQQLIFTMQKMNRSKGFVVDYVASSAKDRPIVESQVYDQIPEFLVSEPTSQLSDDLSKIIGEIKCLN